MLKFNEELCKDKTLVYYPAKINLSSKRSSQWVSICMCLLRSKTLKEF